MALELTKLERAVMDALLDGDHPVLGILRQQYAEAMVRLGYVTRPQLEQVLSDAPPSRVGKAMVERGFLKAHDLYKCLQEQITEIFHGMMLAKDGTFLLIDQELDERALVHNLSLSMQKVVISGSFGTKNTAFPS